jgi:hypothetical protein
VLVADHLPELGPDLVPALPALDVEDLPHGDGGARVPARRWGLGEAGRGDGGGLVEEERVSRGARLGWEERVFIGGRLCLVGPMGPF